MKISFYELLGMVEEGNIPEIVEYNGVQYKADYDDVDDSFLDYLIVDKNKINDSIHFYLGENMLISEMHIKNLLIPKEKNNNIEKLDIYFNGCENKISIEGTTDTDTQIEFVAYKLNDMIDAFCKLKENKKINRVERKARNLTNQYIKDKLNEIIDKVNGEDNESN